MAFKKTYLNLCAITVVLAQAAMHANVFKSEGDCTAIIDGKTMSCETSDCVAVLLKDARLCTSTDCLALLSNDKQCVTTNCRAIKEQKVELCTKDSNCRAIILGDKSQCRRYYKSVSLKKRLSQSRNKRKGLTRNERLYLESQGAMEPSGEVFGGGFCRVM